MTTTSPAEKACLHILQRCVDNRDFSHLMMGTESLELVVLAESRRLGISVYEMQGNLRRAMQARDDQQERNGVNTKPEVERLRDEVDSLVSELDFTREDAHALEVVEVELSKRNEILERIEAFASDADLGVVSFTVDNLRAVLKGRKVFS